MKNKQFLYVLTTFKLDQLYIPGAFLALFVILCLFQLEPDHLFDMSRAYLGAVIPMIGGMMAAYALLDDPMLELRFATPIRMEQLLYERLGIVLVIQVICAGLFQIFIYCVGGDLSGLGTELQIQLAWFIPTVTLMAVGTISSLIGRLSIIGTAITGLVWLFELLARGWLANNSGKYLLVFMGALMSDHPDLVANQMFLAFLSIVFLFISWRLLRIQERYI